VLEPYEGRGQTSSRQSLDHPPGGSTIEAESTALDWRGEAIQARFGQAIQKGPRNQGGHVDIVRHWKQHIVSQATGHLQDVSGVSDWRLLIAWIEDKAPTRLKN
jgi:hypothetical protein